MLLLCSYKPVGSMCGDTLRDRKCNSAGTVRVLLISPLPGLDPACGDVTYTEMLLQNPPDGVIYDTHQSAMQRGVLKEEFTADALRREWRIKGNWLKQLIGGFLMKLINIARRGGLLYKEPFRFFTVTPAEFDLIHVHVFPASFNQLDCPLVISAGCPIQYLYADARGWPKWRLSLTDRLETALGRLLHVDLNSHILLQAQRLITYTEDAREWFSQRKIIQPTQIDIVPIFQNESSSLKQERTPRKILFVAKDFVSKGGRTLLNAFTIVRTEFPQAELHIIGCEPQLSELEQKSMNVTWRPYVPREQLLAMFCDYDVFAYPTGFDCISQVLLEAMSFGLAIATSDYPSMPEAVDFGRAGKVSRVGDVDGLAKNLIELLDPQTNAHFSRAALDHFTRTYSTKVVYRKLLDSYWTAIEQFDSCKEGTEVRSARNECENA